MAKNGTIVRARITLEKDDRLSVSVNPIILKKGDVLEFEVWANFSLPLYSPRRVYALRWKIYFERNSPFDTVGQFQKSETFDLVTYRSEAFRDDFYHHAGILTLGSAQDEGEYKYGIRLSNADNDEEIDDFDPLIIVL